MGKSKLCFGVMKEKGQRATGRNMLMAPSILVDLHESTAQRAGRRD